MEKKNLFLLTLVGGRKEKAYLGALEKYVIEHKNENDNIYIKTIYDDMIVLHDIENFEEILPFTDEEITKISQTLHIEFDNVLKKIKNDEFAQFGSVEEFLIEKFDYSAYDDVIETITDLFLPVCYNKDLTLEERIQDMFDNVVMLNTSNIIEIL